jgi:hypothetical protein
VRVLREEQPDQFQRPGSRRASCFSGAVTKLRTAGLLLIVGSAITFALHLLAGPEELYRWMYHHLLSGLDVPKDPSEGTVNAVRYTSLIGAILELVVGVGLLLVDWARIR